MQSMRMDMSYIYATHDHVRSGNHVGLLMEIALSCLPGEFEACSLCLLSWSIFGRLCMPNYVKFDACKSGFYAVSVHRQRVSYAQPNAQQLVNMGLLYPLHTTVIDHMTCISLLWPAKLQ